MEKWQRKPSQQDVTDTHICSACCSQCLCFFHTYYRDATNLVIAHLVKSAVFPKKLLWMWFCSKPRSLLISLGTPKGESATSNTANFFHMLKSILCFVSSCLQFRDVISSLLSRKLCSNSLPYPIPKGASAHCTTDIVFKAFETL